MRLFVNIWKKSYNLRAIFFFMACTLIIAIYQHPIQDCLPLALSFRFFFLDECIFVLLSDALSRIQKPSFALCHELTNKKSVEYFYTFISNIRRRHIFLIPKTDYILFQARLVFFFSFLSLS